ncbi:MAG: hypothetical protein ACM3NQ_09545 [Bacteroidales bacterium]
MILSFFNEPMKTTTARAGQVKDSEAGRSLQAPVALAARHQVKPAPVLSADGTDASSERHAASGHLGGKMRRKPDVLRQGGLA